MFLAIINDTYSVVKAEITRGQGQLATDFEYLLDKIKKLLARKKRTPAFDALDKSWLDNLNDGKPQSDGVASTDRSKDGETSLDDSKSFHVPTEQDGKMTFDEKHFPSKSAFLSDGDQKGKSGKKARRDKKKSKSDDGTDYTDTGVWEDGPTRGKRSHLSLKLSDFLKQ